MKVAVFSTKPYDREFLTQANINVGHELHFFEAALELNTVTLAVGHEAVCLFVNDLANAEILQQLSLGGTQLIALRCTGFNNVDIAAAAKYKLKVVRVVSYSPYSVAEHAVALLLAINRKIYRAYNRTRDSNFALDGLMGFDLHGKTVAIIGTGKIGLALTSIMRGFGCNILGYDMYPSKKFEALGGRYTGLLEIFTASDIISLHCPLTPETHYLVNTKTLALFKHGAILINTSRGGLIDTEAVIEALKTGQLGGLAIDVYEQEANLFFRDLSSTVISDDVFQRLLSFPNVLVTAHQAFFTEEAISTICETTIQNITEFETGQVLSNEVK